MAMSAVGEVLLGEEHGVAVGVGDELVGGEGLAVGEDGEGRVVFAAGFGEVGGEFVCRSGRRGLRELGTGLRRCRAWIATVRVVALPVGAEVAAGGTGWRKSSV